jgi:23S rRNA (adenine2503-C2)-methyltransferase
MTQLDLYDLSYADLKARLEAWDESAAHADAIWRWLYRDYGVNPRNLGDIPASLRTRLAETTTVTHPQCVTHQISEDHNTQKALLALADGEQIETVLLRYRTRYSVCVSTQVGCRCGCAFCATGQMGFRRQLRAGEIVAQVIHYQRTFADHDERAVTNVVFMGMGEPLLNYDHTLAAVDRCVDPRGLALAPRRITLSTVGIIPGIRKLAEAPYPIKLAVSLHAATDTLRDTLIPINRRYPLDDLFHALRDYVGRTNRRIFFEWLMLKGINDGVDQAEALASRLADLPAHVNLIALNPTDQFEGTPAHGEEEEMEAFVAVLDAHEIPHTMRQRRGSDIAAGCGQLRARQT